MVARPCGDVADVAHVVVQTFQFERQGAQHACPSRHFDPGDLFGRLTEPEPMRDRAHPTYPLGDMEAVDRGHPFYAFFQAPVRVEKARLEVQDGFPHGAEAEVPGFDDPSVNRAHRYLQHALTLDQQVGKLFSGLHRGTLSGLEPLAQGVQTLGPAVMHD